MPGPASHRYPVGFSGDTVVSWASLDFQPQFTAMATNIGYPWWSHDIGGHMHGIRSDELSVHWLQLGVFSPILRLHSTKNDFTSKEPWSYGREAEEIMTDFCACATGSSHTCTPRRSGHTAWARPWSGPCITATQTGRKPIKCPTNISLARS